MTNSPKDISDEVHKHLVNFSVGLVKRGEKAGSAALGSGTLVNIEGRRGILTCGHVAQLYEKLAEIGVVHFREGDTRRQRLLIKLGGAHNITFTSGDKPLVFLRKCLPTRGRGASWG